MKPFLLIFVISVSLFSCKKDTTISGPVPLPLADSFSVSVTNGYGSGLYRVGDTVHIWSKEMSTSQVFDSWSGDNTLLNNNDWHAWFVMPGKNVSLSGALKTITPVTLNFEMIRGRDRFKPVYSYFPAGHKGTVYLLHGTGGSAAQFYSGFEEDEVIKELINDGFAVIITEAEEATTGIDADGDGKLRWNTYPIDTLTNVDYVNIRNISDTFFNRGTTSRIKPRYSLGMSNGGAFSAALSYGYRFKAGISYCAPGGSALAAISTVPFQFCMQRFDNNPNVGPQGNADALSNSQTLTSRGICSKYFINEHSPLYPQRFARKTDISLPTSANIFNELKSHGFLNAKNYFVGYSTDLAAAVTASPASYPVIATLTGAQKLFVLDEIDCCVTDHHFFSDFTKRSLKFLNTQCL